MRRQLVVGLGVLGIAPFLLALLWPDVETGLIAFSLYSLAIFCFLAGSWWSTALIAPSVSERARLRVLIASNLLVLTALLFVFLVLQQGLTSALLGMAVLYGVLMAGEWRLAAFRGQPSYYRSMRAGVSSLVAVLHVLFWLGTPAG